MRRRRRNITIVNNEIDYDKLAEAIVRANAIKPNESEDDDINNKKPTVLEVLKVFINIIFNKKKSDGTLASSFLCETLVVFFNGLAVLGALVFGVGLFAFVKMFKGFVWSLSVILIVKNVFTIAGIVVILLIIALFSLIFRALANEIANEKDRNYIVDLFSGVFSFVALIISLIALLKGVG